MRLVYSADATGYSLLSEGDIAEVVEMPAAEVRQLLAAMRAIGLVLMPGGQWFLNSELFGDDLSARLAEHVAAPEVE